MQKKELLGKLSGNNRVITGNSPAPPRASPQPREEACRHVLPAGRRTQWGVAPGPCFRQVSSPVH